MACETDKCEKYGMHHDFENGVEVRKCQFCQRDDQPERSKREDLPNLIYKPTGDTAPPLEATCTYSEAMNKYWDKMRCSEHSSNAVREVR